MRQDISLINNSKTNELIKYTWNFCINKYNKFLEMRKRIYNLRLNLINSIIRCYYIAFICKG